MLCGSTSVYTFKGRLEASEFKTSLFFLLLAVVLTSYLITICTAPGTVRRYADSESTALVSVSFGVREIICFLSCQCDIREFIAC